MSAAPDGSAGVASDPRSDAATARRAVPRGSGGVAPSTPSESSVAPSRRAPEYRSTPDTYSPGISSRPEVYRAVPRSERPAARDNDIYAPTPSYRGVPGGVPDRSYRCRARPAHPVRMLRIAAARCHGRDRTAADRRTVIAPPSVPNPPRVLARGQAPSAARRDRRAHRRQRHHPSRRANRQAQGSFAGQRGAVGGIGWR